MLLPQHPRHPQKNCWLANTQNCNTDTSQCKGEKGAMATKQSSPAMAACKCRKRHTRAKSPARRQQLSTANCSACSTSVSYAQANRATKGSAGTDDWTERPPPQHTVPGRRVHAAAAAARQAGRQAQNLACHAMCVPACARECASEEVCSEESSRAAGHPH